MLATIIKLLDEITVATDGEAFQFGTNNTPGASAKAAFQAIMTGVGALTATVVIQVSLDGVHWLDEYTITLGANDLAQYGHVLDAPWRHVRGRCTALGGAGTGKKLSLLMGTV